MNAKTGSVIAFAGAVGGLAPAEATSGNCGAAKGIGLYVVMAPYRCQAICTVSARLTPA